jgi:hypothetical protein
MARITGFVADTQTQITNLLQFADSWSALQQEYSALTTNNALPTQADIDAVFGTGVLTLAQYTTALTTMQAVVDSIHVSATRAALYRVRK